MFTDINIYKGTIQFYTKGTKVTGNTLKKIMNSFDRENRKYFEDDLYSQNRMDEIEEARRPFLNKGEMNRLDIENGDSIDFYIFSKESYVTELINFALSYSMELNNEERDSLEGLRTFVQYLQTALDGEDPEILYRETETVVCKAGGRLDTEVQNDSFHYVNATGENLRKFTFLYVVDNYDKSGLEVMREFIVDFNINHGKYDSSLYFKNESSQILADIIVDTYAYNHMIDEIYLDDIYEYYKTIDSDMIKVGVPDIIEEIDRVSKGILKKIMSEGTVVKH